MAASPKRTAPYKHVDRVEVHLWDHLVGVVALDPAYGFYAFRFTPQFQALGIDPSPLQMPVREDRTFLFTDLPESTYKRLPAMLADAMPDDFGNALIDRWMADRGLSPREVTPLDRLAYMGNRAMGALQFKPVRGPTHEKPIAIELGALVEEAREAVAGRIAGDDETQAALGSIIEVGTSAGGARAKAVIAWNRETDKIRSGQMSVPRGFEHWLLKFDGMGRDSELGATQDYGRIEYAYHLMARRAGIDMMESRLLLENGRAHFMTRRFDREDGDLRHHVQSLCAMDHLDYRKKGTNAYSQLFSVAVRLNLLYKDKEEIFRRMAFNAMVRNCDDHTKNFSFRLRQNHAWELAPAYDVTFAHNPLGEWTNRHLQSINGKFEGFQREDFLTEAERFGVGTAKRVLEQVRAAVKEWPQFAGEAGLSQVATHFIGDQLAPLE